MVVVSSLIFETSIIGVEPTLDSIMRSKEGIWIYILIIGDACEVNDLFKSSSTRGCGSRLWVRKCNNPRFVGFLG